MKAGAKCILVSEKDSVKIDPSVFSLPVFKVIIEVEILEGQEVFTKLILEQ